MQLMAAAIKQEEGAQADALHRQRAMEKRLHEISKVRALTPVARQRRLTCAPRIDSRPVRP